MTCGLQVDEHRRIWVIRWEVHIKFEASIGIWSFSRSSYQHLRKKNNGNDTNKIDLIHRQVVHTQALCFYCLISKFPVWLWHLATDIGNRMQHCAPPLLNSGTGKTSCLVAQQWTDSDCRQVSHVRTFTLWQSFTICLQKRNNSHGLFNEAVGSPVPLHDTFQWWMNTNRDGHEDAKNSYCCGATATAWKYTQQVYLVFSLSTYGRERPTQSAFHTRLITISI